MFRPPLNSTVCYRTPPPCFHTTFENFTIFFFSQKKCFFCVQVDGTFHRSSWGFHRSSENFHEFNGSFQLSAIPFTGFHQLTSIDFRLLPPSPHMLASATMSFRPYRRGGGRAAHSLVYICSSPWSSPKRHMESYSMLRVSYQE